MNNIFFVYVMQINIILFSSKLLFYKFHNGKSITMYYYYIRTFDEDKHFAKKVYSVDSNEDSIMQEIMKNGPVVAANLDVYAEFFTYKSGVYQHIPGESAGRHSVRLVCSKKPPYTLFYDQVICARPKSVSKNHHKLCFTIK